MVIATSGDITLHKGRAPAGSIHETLTNGSAFTAISADLATGNTIIISGAIYNIDTTNVLSMSYATRTDSTHITIYGAGDGAPGSDTYVLTSGAAASANMSLAW